MKEVAYAGFWIRTAAALIDTVLVLLLIGPVLTLKVRMLICGSELGPMLAQTCGADFGLLATLASGFSGVLITYILPGVAVILFWAFKSATPGKMVLGLRIVDATTGGKPSTGQMIGRYLGYYVSTIPLLLGIFWVAIDRRKQGWHDKLAGTVVVRDPPANLVATFTGR